MEEAVLNAERGKWMMAGELQSAPIIAPIDIF